MLSFIISLVKAQQNHTKAKDNEEDKDAAKLAGGCRRQTQCVHVHTVFTRGFYLEFFFFSLGPERG